MGARQKLNMAYFTGSLIVAALIGMVVQSWSFFLVALAVLLVLNLSMNEIRPTRQRRGQGRKRAAHQGE
jgi:hypothetical protein